MRAITWIDTFQNNLPWPDNWVGEREREKDRQKCLVHIWPAMGLYGARILPVSPFPCGLREALLAEAGGGWEMFVRIHGLHGLYTILFSGKCTTAQRPHAKKTARCTAVAPRSPYHLRAASARKPHGLRTITVWKLRRLHDNSTEIARFPYNLRAASVRIYPGLPPPPPPS